MNRDGPVHCSTEHCSILYVCQWYPWWLLLLLLGTLPFHQIPMNHQANWPHCAHKLTVLPALFCGRNLSLLNLIKPQGYTFLYVSVNCQVNQSVSFSFALVTASFRGHMVFLSWITSRGNLGALCSDLPFMYSCTRASVNNKQARFSLRLSVGLILAPATYN